MKLGPDNATLTVRTGRGGAAAKAGHDLVLEVTRWSATLEDDAAELTADARSLRVRSGSGGISPLGDAEKAGIAQTIDAEVLKGRAIAFRSTSVARAGETVEIAGELELAGQRRPLTFTLKKRDGDVAGSVRIKQTDWGMKPYSALFGTLKVADVVEVAIETRSVNHG
jgi:polyisoprenoid-binding protein YceI